MLKFIAMSATSALLLSGCESMKSMGWPWQSGKLPNECPVTGITTDLGNLTQFRDNEIISETIIASVKPECTQDEKAVTVRLAIDFKGRLGPAGIKDAKTEASYSIPYLVAVVNPKGEIISKDIFTITMIYKAGQAEQSFPDLLEQVIPLPKGEKPADYKIMLGFQLSDEELAYNRALAAQKTAK
ncbi:MAG: hypothetical protein DI586_09620 [Micavibrio aeruginosavorus]|uniref:Lipoprotein n=1 Tax=Micavibrio aeruginosavorus TaxID=349221 RepID=A0A2W5FEV0_9BACT|nr:MAG: hypothetical protein DI586_09620 [Micavibrio aeruginosavorus]